MLELYWLSGSLCRMITTMTLEYETYDDEPHIELDYDRSNRITQSISVAPTSRNARSKLIWSEH